MAAESQRVAQIVVTARDDAAGGSHLENVQSHYFLGGKHTAGAFSLTEILFQRGAGGTPLHRHAREEETYYVIEGELQIQVGEQTFVLGPGGSALLPRGIKHKVTPAADKTTRALMIISPPGLENMLMTLDEVRPGELDLSTVAQLSEEYGLQLLDG